MHYPCPFDPRPRSGLKQWLSAAIDAVALTLLLAGVAFVCISLEHAPAAPTHIAAR